MLDSICAVVDLPHAAPLSSRASTNTTSLRIVLVDLSEAALYITIGLGVEVTSYDVFRSKRSLLRDRLRRL